MPEPVRALVVAPSEALRILINDALRDAAASYGRGVEVTEVADGFFALSRIGRGTFDLVIADADLPVLGTDELVQLLRARPEQASLPFVAVGAEASEEGTRLPVGATLLPSPFTPEALREALSLAGFRFEEGA